MRGLEEVLDYKYWLKIKIIEGSLVHASDINDINAESNERRLYSQARKE